MHNQPTLIEVNTIKSLLKDNNGSSIVIVVVTTLGIGILALFWGIFGHVFEVMATTMPYFAGNVSSSINHDPTVTANYTYSIWNLSLFGLVGMLIVWGLINSMTER